MAGFDGNGLTDLLYAASQDAPPSGVDFGAVLIGGRKRRRRRAIVTPLVVAAAIVAVAAGGVAAANLRPWSGAPVSPASGGPTASALTTTPTATTPVVPTEFPLDRQRCSLDAFGETTFLRLGAGAQYVGYSDGSSVWCFVRGADEARQTAEQEYERADAPTVNDLTAYYLLRDDGGGALLRGISFQWAPGAWADILPSRTTSETELIDLAGSLRTGLDETVRFWFTVSPPPGLRLDRAEPANQGEESHWSSLHFTLESGPLPDLPAFNAPGVEVTIGDYFDGPADATTTVQGHPARISDTDEYYSVELIENEGFTVHGVKVTIWGAARSRFSAAQAEALVLSVVVLGSWEDRSQWTDDPIR